MTQARWRTTTPRSKRAREQNKGRKAGGRGLAGPYAVFLLGEEAVIRPTHAPQADLARSTAKAKGA